MNIFDHSMIIMTYIDVFIFIRSNPSITLRIEDILNKNNI